MNPITKRLAQLKINSESEDSNPGGLYQEIKKLTDTYGSPLWLYDQQVIEERIKSLQAFDVIRYAQKALSTLEILRLMRRNGVVVDAVSGGEILRALKAGYVGDKGRAGISEIQYTADLFDEESVELIREQCIAVNVGSSDMIEALAQISPESKLTIRINPGFGHGHSEKTNTGGPLSKHGVWYEELPAVLKRIKELGLKLYGLHLHIGSGTDMEHLNKVAKTMVSFVRELKCHEIRSISAGGGIPIPYYPHGEQADITSYHKIWSEAKREIAGLCGDISLEIEPGRYLVAESGFLITKVCSVKANRDKDFAIIDAGFNTLIRPAMYGSYHHISLISPKKRVLKSQLIVAGPLCESGDIFTRDGEDFVKPRGLPMPQKGDFLVIHDAGAYGSVMSSNYNSKTLAAELLASESAFLEIRKRQELNELFHLEL